MTTLAPEDPQRRQEEQAANLLKDLFGSKIDALVRGGVKVSVITKPETVIQDIVDRLGVTKSPGQTSSGPATPAAASSASSASNAARFLVP